MTSIIPNTRMRNSSASVSMRNFENPPSSFPRPKIIPLESVSPEMASALIDELMRVIEEQAEVKLHEMGKPNELKGEEYTPQNPPRMYNGRSFYEVNGQSRHPRSPSVVYTSVPQPSLQQRSGSISQPSAVSPPPLNLSRTRDSISATTDSHPGSPFRRRSRFILVDQTEVHPGNRIDSVESNVYKPTVLPQKFPTRMDSIRQEEKPTSLPSLTSRRHSIDANQSYMSLSDTASVHEDSQQNSLLNYKKWMGAGKTGSRVTSQKSTSPVVVIEKPVKAKPAASKSKSFFSHFKYEMHPTPMYYVPDHKTKPKPGGQTKHPKRFSIDGSSSRGNSLGNIERTHTKSSSSVSTHSKEKKQELHAQNASKWPIPPPSRSPPQTPQVPLLAPQKSENTISQLPWNTKRIPVANSDLHFVEGWLADTNVETDSPADPQSPIFSEKEIPSTAATSPIGSNRLSVVFEDHRPARLNDRGSKMQSRIISWVDLEGCTSEFVQSLQVLGTVEGLAPELSPVDDSSIVPTPSSKYTGDVFVGMGKSELDLIAAALERQSSPPFTLALANKEHEVELPTTTTTATPPPRSRSTSESSSNSNNNTKRPRPHISPLVIPTSSYNIFPPQPTAITKNKIPVFPSFGPSTTSTSPNTTANTTLTPNTQKPYNFAEEDSPTLPPLLTLPLPPPRSSKRVRRPATPSLPKQQVQSQTQEDEETPPPIPTRLRPFTPPKPKTFRAPPTGLTLHLSRYYISQEKSEWVITSSTTSSSCPTPFLISFSATTSSFNNSGSSSSSSRIDFTSLPQQGGQGLFTYFPRSGVAETGDGKVIFGVREGVFGSWVVGVDTHTNANDNTNNNESGGVKKLQVRVSNLDDGREMDVWHENPQNMGSEVDAREMVGKIVAKGRNTVSLYIFLPLFLRLEWECH